MLSVEETLLDRYAINRYSERHAALDCRECNEKILDLTDDDFITASVILDRIASHNDNYHRPAITVFNSSPQPVRHRK